MSATSRKVRGMRAVSAAAAAPAEERDRDGEAGWEDEFLLRTRDCDVDLPLVEPERHRADGGDAVQEEECVMSHGVPCSAQRSDGRDDAGGGIIMRGEHGPDPAADIGAEHRLDLDRAGYLAPVALDHRDVAPVGPAHVDPAVRGHPDARRQHPGAGRERVARRDLRTGRVPIAGKTNTSPAAVPTTSATPFNAGYSVSPKKGER